jgi:hypothetical protein
MARKILLVVMAVIVSFALTALGGYFLYRFSAQANEHQSVLACQSPSQSLQCSCHRAISWFIKQESRNTNRNRMVGIMGVIPKHLLLQTHSRGDQCPMRTGNARNNCRGSVLAAVSQKGTDNVNFAFVGQ